jgi:hypothetical protein
VGATGEASVSPLTDPTEEIEMPEEIDAFDEAPVASKATLADLLTKAEEFIGLDKQIKELEDLLITLNGRSNELKTKVIPDKMAEIGITEFATPEGKRLRIEKFVAGSLPKEPEKRAAAIKALESWEADDVIKSELNLKFSKQEHNQALALADDLRNQGFAVEVTSGVHPQTYCALIRERLEDGDPVDLEVMGVFVGNKTKIVEVKQKKGRKDA